MSNVPALLDRRALARVANQAGGDVLPDKGQWTNRFQIRSETSTRLYVVAQNKNTGEFGCSCPAWCTRRTCKHLNAIKPALQAASMPRPLATAGRR